jgi:stage II sporulation protein D
VAPPRNLHYRVADVAGRRSLRAALLTAAVAGALGLTASAHAGTLFLVEGGGWGHGVGLGQWGTEGAALHGWSYRQILAHYYPGSALTVVPTRSVRVLLGERRPRLSLGSRSPYLLVDGHGRRVHVPARTLHFGIRLRYGGRRLVPPLRIEPGVSQLRYDGKAYRGSLELLVRKQQFSVVNVVPLELYLRGVVPSEMPKHWQPAAYQAQAVVARTYAIAEVRSRGDYDLVADADDQVYRGVAAEQTDTNLAIGQTAQQVLTYGGRIITAYYSASTGGRTEAVQDGFPGHAPEPYLVSVPDPYDVISPLHHWLVPMSPQALAKRVGFAVTDAQVARDAAGHAVSVTLLGAHGSRVLSGSDFRDALRLRSTNFTIRVLSLDTPRANVSFGTPLALTGFVRGIGGVSVQEQTPAGSWRLAGRVRAAPDGRFVVHVRPQTTTTYRLAVDQLPGPSVPVVVAPSITVQADPGGVAGTVRPSVPVRIERVVNGAWRVVAQVPVGPSGHFRRALAHGRYRVTAVPGRRLASASSLPLVVKR